MSSNFLTFNPASANQETDAAYATDATRTGGAGVDAVWPSVSANKTLKQSTIFPAAFGQMMAAKGFTVSDADQNALAAVLANVVTTADQRGGLQTVTWASSLALNAASHTNFQITLGGDTALSATGQAAGDTVTLLLAQDATGGRVVTYGAGFAAGWQLDATPNTLSVVTFKTNAALLLEPSNPSVSISGINATPIGAATPSTGNFTTPVATDNSTSAATTAWAKLGLQISLGTTGYIKMPTWLGGWVAQWGTSASALPTGGQNAQLTINYPGSSLFTVTPTVLCQPNNYADNTDGGSKPYPFSCYPTNVGTSSFTANAAIAVQANSGNGFGSIANAVHINWIALGK